jgi:hypothetical protein
MSTDPLRIERRQTQRFSFHLPVSVRLAGGEQEGYGFTQDLSGRGALFYTEFPLAEGDAVELTLLMPAEITMAESSRVRCLCKVMRILPPTGGTACGVAVHFERYEFLPEAEKVKGSGAFGRVSGLHQETPRQDIGLALPHKSSRNALRP